MKALRYKCPECGAVKDINLDSTFDDLDERTIHRRILVSKVFNPKDQVCDHCGEQLDMKGVVEV